MRIMMMEDNNRKSISIGYPTMIELVMDRRSYYCGCWMLVMMRTTAFLHLLLLWWWTRRMVTTSTTIDPNDDEEEPRHTGETCYWNSYRR
jgi:hypothetical protein